MFSTNALRKRKTVAARKKDLCQALLSSSGTLVDPRTLPQQAPAPVAAGGNAVDSPIELDDNSTTNSAPVYRRVHNVSTRNVNSNTVNYSVPDSSGRLSSTVSGVISRKMPRKDGETTIFLRRDNGGEITVRGNLPIAETGMHVTMQVYQTWENRREIYIFQKICKNGVVALPVTGLQLRNILKERTGLEQQVATEVALIIAEKFVDPAIPSKIKRLESCSVPIAHIYDNFKNEIWYPALCKSWGKLKYKFYPDLLLFWEYDDLARLEIADLEELYNRFRENPINFFLKDYHSSRLPVIPEEKASLLKDVMDVEFTDSMYSLIKFFNAVSEEVSRTKCLALIKSQLDEALEKVVPSELRSEVLKMALGPRYRLLKPVKEENLAYDRNRRGESLIRFYRLRDYNHLRLLKIRLARILNRPTNCIEPLEGVVGPPMTDEQKCAVNNLISKTNIVLVSGDGGTGKTRVCSAVYELYGARRCLAVAAYTGLATRNQRLMSRNVEARGITIALIIESIKRGTKSGLKIAEETEVLIVDEIGVVGLSDFEELLEKLPNVKKILLSGDVKQSRPVTAGRVLDGFLESWRDTDAIVYLTENQRVDADSKILIDNFDYFLKGNFKEMKFSNDLLDSIPFKIIRRQNYPSNLPDRSPLMRRELNALYVWLSQVEKDPTQIRIISHTHNDVKALNMAWMSLKQRGLNGNGQTVLSVGDLVRFTKPWNVQYKSKRRIVPAHIRCSIISTNDVAEISEIYDISSTANPTVAYRNRKIIRSTDEPFVTTDTVRILKFTNGNQVNLRDYDIANICPGYATTILSAIGHECNYVVVWVPPWQKHVYRELFYTAITRAKKAVILIMNISENYDIERSDMASIWGNVPAPTENAIAAYVPRIPGSQSNSNAANEESESGSEQFNNDFFDPVSNFERQMMEEQLAEYEYACPILGDTRLEEEAERVLKYVNELKANERKEAVVLEEQLQQDDASEDSQWTNFDQRLYNYREFQASSNLFFENTKTMEHASSNNTPNATPPQPKRHFAFITESRLKKQAESSEDLFDSKPKRLKRGTTQEFVVPETTRTQLDLELDLLRNQAEGVNPFGSLVEHRELKRQRSSRILED